MAAMSRDAIVRKVSIRELYAKTGKLIDEAALGEPIIIERRGRQIGETFARTRR